MYKVKLPLKYFYKRKITSLAVISVAICVFIIVVVMTVHSGIVEQFKTKNHNFYSDCIISTNSMVGFGGYQEFLYILDKQDFVKAASPVISSIAMLRRSGYDENIAVDLIGIDIERHLQVSNFANTLFYNKGDPENAFKSKNSQMKGFIAGVAMMGSRGGDGKYFHPPYIPSMEIELSCIPLTAKGAMQKADSDYVNTAKFILTDDSESKIAKVDGKTIYIDFKSAQILCGMNGNNPRANMIFVKFVKNVPLEIGRNKIAGLWNDFYNSKKGSAESYLLEDVTVQDWKTYCRDVIAPMEKEQVMLTILFMMVGITSVFIVFVVFYMIVNSKLKDIAIIRSFGGSWIDILKIYMLLALIIAIAASVIGLVLGKIFLLNINDIESWLYHSKGWQVFDRSVYAIDDLPSQTSVFMFFIIAFSAIIACLAGAVVPAIKAARKKPVEILKVGQI